MIICTYFGMFMPALRPPKTIPEGDNRVIQVRSRRAIDLDRLRAIYMPDLGPTIRMTKTDYQYRAYCTRRDLADALALIALDINYTKFKDTPRDEMKDPALSHAYGMIWSAALNAFPDGSVYAVMAARNRWRSPTRPVVRTETTVTRRQWWEDSASLGTWHPTQLELPDVLPDRDPTDAELQAIADELERDEPDHYARMHTGPVVRNGRVDHSRCDHAMSKNARERCRRRLRKAGQL